MEMKFSKTLLTGRAEAAIESIGYNADTYRIAWDILARDFGLPELVVNAQLKRLHSYPFNKPHDTAELTKYSHCLIMWKRFEPVWS